MDETRTARATKHQRVREILRQRIQTGVYSPGMRLPPEAELLKNLKAGDQTIRHALNDLVREGLIVRRRGSGSFVTDRTLCPLLPGRDLKLAVLWSMSVNPERIRSIFQGRMTLGVLDALGIDLSTAAWTMAQPNEMTKASWRDKARRLQIDCLGEAMKSHPRHPPLNEIRAGNYNGILTLSIIEDSFLEELTKLGVPVVFADTLNEKFLTQADQVFVDPSFGYRQAVRHFAGLGLRRIHFVPGYIGRQVPGPDASEAERLNYERSPYRVDPDSYLRQSAYRQGMDECGLKVEEAWIHMASDPIRREAELLAKLTALPLEQRPEAVIAHTAHDSERLIEAYAQHGWKLHGAGAGQPGEYKHSLPIQIDGHAMGDIAMDLLLARVQRPGRPCLRVGVPMSLHLADSSGQAVQAGDSAARTPEPA
jgi:DNA-binding LacI/PurR family transcriptional regulator